MRPRSRPRGAPCRPASLGAALSLLCACAPDYGLAPGSAGLRSSAGLELLPPRLQLPAAPAGASSRGALELRNAGGSTLRGFKLQPGGTGNFDVLNIDLDELSLAPGERARLEIEGWAGGGGAEGWLRVQHGAVGAQAELAIDALQPSLLLDPSPLSLGSAPDGCAAEGELFIENDGELALHIEQLQAIGEGFSVLDGPTGWIEPGERWPVQLAFDGARAGEATGALWVQTDRLGQRSAALEAHRAPPVEITESMQQDGPWPAVDLLLVADRSGSMAEDLRAIGAEAERLFEALADRSPGALVSVVTRDDGCLSAGPLSPTAPESRAALAAGLLGPWGRATEAGMSLARAAFEADRPGGCNAGLRRPEARPVVVFISDEAEQSAGGWAEALDALRAAEPELQVLAVVGPPEGCATANPGHGYLEATAATGGEAWSICAEDWSALAAALGARAAGAGTDRWTLSSPARPHTLQLRLDGRPWSRWSFDVESNTVRFDPSALPPPGATLEASYQRAEACDGAAPAG